MAIKVLYSQGRGAGDNQDKWSCGQQLLSVVLHIIKVKALAPFAIPLVYTTTDGTI